MKPHNRAKIAFIKWTSIIFIPVIILLMILLVTRNFKATNSIAAEAAELINEMFEYRAFKIDVAHRGYELFIDSKG